MRSFTVPYKCIPKKFINFRSIRKLHLHEYQSKELLSKYNVNTQPFHVGGTIEDVVKGSKLLQNANDKLELVMKAQILAGGRGKGTFIESGLKGGVKLTNKIEEVASLASQMLNNHLQTEQTPKNGVLVRKIMIAEAVNIVKETYFAIIMDRISKGPILLASPMGGVNIEAVAHDHPDQIFTERVDIDIGATRDQTERLARRLGFSDEHVIAASEQMQRLYKLFIDVDSVQVEVNPLALTDKGKVMAIDAKIQFDENASFRQAEFFSQKDTSEENQKESAASKNSLNYISLDGDIGCLVNGAGLAMATMDLIHLMGGSPANFLDVGGNATKSQVIEAFKILTADSQVKVILVNIFGGIMRCDIIAEGIIAAVKEFGLKIPLVVRLSGTNADAALAMLDASKLNVITATNMESAARLACREIKMSKGPENFSDESIIMTSKETRKN